MGTADLLLTRSSFCLPNKKLKKGGIADALNRAGGELIGAFITCCFSQLST